MPPPTDAQTDVQNAPVDDESLMRKLARMLEFFTKMKEFMKETCEETR